jgi:hypothetical protein
MMYTPVIPAPLKALRRPAQAKSQELTRATWYYWLTPVILATSEAEIRRITVQGHPKANSSQDPISKILSTKKG